MKREVKFRVWDGKAMYSNPAWMVEVSDGTVWLNTGSHGVDALESREVELMQFTGLKDKNGVELYYDSDIVRLDGRDGLWIAVKDDFDIPHFLPAHGAFGINVPFEQVFMSGSRDCFEIVGNVHEHAHLLEQPQPSDTDGSDKTRRTR